MGTRYCSSIARFEFYFIKQMKIKKIIFSSLTVLLFGKSLTAQVLYPDSELIDYYRVQEIKSNQAERLNIFPSIIQPYETASMEWNLWEDNLLKNTNEEIHILPVRWSNHFNSAYARGYNDGAVWKGKGLTSSLQGGFQGNKGVLSFTFAPIVFYSQNATFDLAEQRGNNNPFNYQFRNTRIDYVQRYGDQSFTHFDWGQSEIRLIYKSFTLGISTQNITLGPAQQNPLILSNNAAGIPHLDIGTHTPIQTKIGRLEGKVYYGILPKSDYFLNGDRWNYRYWSGFSVAYSPSFLPDLTLGFNRAFYQKAADFSPVDLLVFINNFDDTDGNPAINDEFDQKGSITMRWLFPEVGFEAYAEYGKNDFGGKFWGTSPEHSRAYTLGFSKYVDIKNDNVLKLTYEHTSLDKPRNSLYRFNNSWYSHGIVSQGYTINGQLIGGGIGSGSVGDFFEAQYFFPKGRWAMSAQRVRFDDDYFFDNILDINRHDHEWTLNSRFSRFVGTYLIGIDLGVSFRQNQYFIANNDKTNISLGLSVLKSLSF